MANHNKLGKEGEKIATDYLRKKGYSIRHCNWKAGNLELDIVAETKDYLVIVEVKTRSTEYFEHPKDAINNGKIKRIVHATEEYIYLFNIKKEVRFDVIALLPNKNNGYKIEHIEDAFLPPVN